MRFPPLMLIAVLLVCGCTDRPEAPVLLDLPVYDNAFFGMRFSVPADWQQVARSDVPREAKKRDRLLVRYRPPAGARAVVEVAAREAPEGADIAAMLQAASHSAGAWTLSGSPENLTIDGQSAQRFQLTTRDQVKISVVFRRREYLVFITYVAPTTEQQTRDEFDQLLQSIEWTG